MLDFIRIACAVPEVKVGDVKKNAADICAFMERRTRRMWIFCCFRSWP